MLTVNQKVMIESIITIVEEAKTETKKTDTILDYINNSFKKRLTEKEEASVRRILESREILTLGAADEAIIKAFCLKLQEEKIKIQFKEELVLLVKDAQKLLEKDIKDKNYKLVDDAIEKLKTEDISRLAASTNLDKKIVEDRIKSKKRIESMNLKKAQNRAKS